MPVFTHRTIPAVATILAVSLAAAISGPAAAQSDPETTDAGDALDGVWAIDPTIGSFDYAADDFSGSWVGYRVQEELVGVGGTEAVGRTPDVEGSVVISGTTLESVDMTADLTTLESDEGRRDGQLGRQGIETDRFPTATFTLTEPIVLDALPAEGEMVSVTALGDLTLHGVTEPVSIPLAAVWQDDVIGVSGSVTFNWADFDMEQPSSLRVVSLADDVTMELQLFLRHDADASPEALLSSTD